MIIVSQDKTRLINFERVEILGIDLKNNKQICCGFNQGNIVLGKYATEERTKEVLQEIIEAIRGKSEISITQGEIKSECFGGFYEMPED